MSDTFRPVHPADMPHRIAALEAENQRLEQESNRQYLILMDIDELCEDAINADNTSYFVKKMGQDIRELVEKAWSKA